MRRLELVRVLSAMLVTIPAEVQVLARCALRALMPEPTLHRV